MSNSDYLKEMGIVEWVSRDQPPTVDPSIQATAPQESQIPDSTPIADGVPQGNWWFFGNPAQGDMKILFQNIIRVLGLAPNEWSWKNPADPLNQLTIPDNGLPIVAFAFGGPVAQKITGERDSLPQLRETVLALNIGNDEDVPLIASYDLAQAIARPNDKALLWQDLLLAKSVLQNV